MTDSEKLVIVQRALKLACKFLRDNPPGDLSLYPDIDYIAACMGAASDPEGKNWQILFLRKAMNMNEKTTEIG